jgi:hypothetical protein
MDKKKILEALTSGIFVIAVAVVGLLGVIVTAFFTSKNNNKNIFINTVTGERAKWRNDLRNDAAELCKRVYKQMQNQNAGNKPRIQELTVLIRLRLNPDPKHILDKTIIDATWNLLVALDDSNGTNVTHELQVIESNVQKLLKQEWEKSKKEARKGKLVVNV